MTTVSLPQFVVLKSTPTCKYLQYVKDGGKVSGCVQFSAENVWAPEAKFEVEKSKSGNGLVHIRSVYNNKYLTLAPNNCIVATSQHKEEDHTKPSCTLLKPTPVNGDRAKIRLASVHGGKNLCNWSSDLSSNDQFNVVDWDTLVILPKYVNFKGDNNKHLKNHGQNGHEFLRFLIDNVTDSPESTGHEIFPNPDGTVRIKNIQTGNFWKAGDGGWIYVESKIVDNKNTVFEPFKLGPNTIALRSLSNNKFCTRLNADGKESCLHANTEVVNKWAIFVVSEHIVSREIKNVNFRLMDSRIYNERCLIMASVTVNNTTQNKHEEIMDLTHTETTSKTCNKSVSLKVGTKVTFDIGLPKIFEGKVEISGELGGQYAWGDTETTTTTVVTHYKAPVPPMTKVTVRMVGTEACCDVPFSYTQRDRLYIGKTVSTEVEGGVYTGVNSYNVYIEVKEEPLSNSNANGGVHYMGSLNSVGAAAAHYNGVQGKLLGNNVYGSNVAPTYMGVYDKPQGNIYGSNGMASAEFKRVAKVSRDGKIVKI